MPRRIRQEGTLHGENYVHFHPFAWSAALHITATSSGFPLLTLFPGFQPSIEEMVRPTEVTSGVPGWTLIQTILDDISEKIRGPSQRFLEVKGLDARISFNSNDNQKRFVHVKQT